VDVGPRYVRVRGYCPVRVRQSVLRASDSLAGRCGRRSRDLQYSAGMGSTQQSRVIEGRKGIFKIAAVRARAARDVKCSGHGFVCSGVATSRYVSPAGVQHAKPDTVAGVHRIRARRLVLRCVVRVDRDGRRSE